ncbi:hypothetical protein WA026_021040 [Henosepilachna vigintioctopunctata]|uniref:Uncharacterized protein n=1 Tax=Henosepilachna vigintioctopunctata TaxID=420089 RepID=A0AAW1UWI7_9CUCU
MSAICQNFVQNAWKKELCSNCFKSRNEHQDRHVLKPLPLFSKRIESIIKSGKKTKKIGHRSVRFPSQLTEVIGYGGEDWSSENEEDSDEKVDDDFDDDSDDFDGLDEDLQKITKANTDFNSTSLLEEAENKKSFASLLLGKPIVDSDGNKKTLLVTVKPFGEDGSSSPKKISKSLAHIPISKNKKESVTESKTNVILKSYTKNDELQQKEEKSLLDEITETLENSKKDALQIMSRKKNDIEIPLTLPSKETNKENIENECNKNESTQKSEKKITLSRTPALKREHALLYQTAAKIEFMNNKNSKINKDIRNKDMKKTETVQDTEEKEQNIDEEITNTIAVIKEVEKDSKWEISNEKSCEEDKISSPDSSLTSTSTNNDFDNVGFTQSREQAGEPDGRADSDNSEPPALPLTPPPVLESQNSFLHSSNVAIIPKPKIPSKPNTVLIRKPVIVHHIEAKSHILTTFSSEPLAKELHKELTKQDSSGSEEAVPISNKRKAPRPPDEGGLYVRKPLNSMNGESPVVREKEKRDRASSCPKLPTVVAASPKIEFEICPEPAPRKNLSVSTDSLASADDGKRKEKTKGKFSLKKFLRMGSNKDLSKLPIETYKFDEIDSAPLPKPRLVIVHPSELNGAKVEVVAKTLGAHHIEGTRVSNEYENVKSPKPLPPPRNLDDHSQKPPLSPPPKSADVLNIQRQVSRNNSLSKKEETVYANIGEVRSSIVPNKPVRTASMREREALLQKQKEQESSNYSSATLPGKRTSENMYDYLPSGRSSSPDSDSSREKNSPKANKLNKLNKRSESSIDVSGDYFKYSNIPRSVSLTYCGSETESEIFSPYSFYGSETEVTEDDHEWIQNGRTHKLRSRKGRSIVHKNLEDNYGAVIVANHEALAQVLENIQQSVHIPPVLRGLKSISNLRCDDFTIKTVNPVVLGKRTFHQALWGTHHVTLSINRGLAPSCTLSLGTFNLIPVTEFSDLVPLSYVGENETNESKQVQATIIVLPWMQVNSMQSFSSLLKIKSAPEESSKDALFVLLQLVNALKNLQAQGIEELPLSLNSFILCKDMERESHQKLYLLRGLSEELSQKNEKFGTLCACASKALQLLQPSSKITSLIQSLLNNERATSLTQVKSILEFTLWGPSDVALGSTIRERELALQRWLDLQRATVLHGLVCTRVQLTVYEEYHLLFLVRSNARMMCDASLLLESSNMKQVILNGTK